MIKNHKLIFIKLVFLLSISLSIFAYTDIDKTVKLQQTMLDQQATNHLKTLANGSIDDLLARDYGDLEQWVVAAAAGE